MAIAAQASAPSTQNVTSHQALRNAGTASRASAPAPRPAGSAAPPGARPPPPAGRRRQDGHRHDQAGQEPADAGVAEGNEHRRREGGQQDGHRNPPALGRLRSWPLRLEEERPGVGRTPVRVHRRRGFPQRWLGRRDRSVRRRLRGGRRRRSLGRGRHRYAWRRFVDDRRFALDKGYEDCVSPHTGRDRDRNGPGRRALSPRPGDAARLVAGRHDQEVRGGARRYVDDRRGVVGRRGRVGHGTLQDRRTVGRTLSPRTWRCRPVRRAGRPEP